MIALAALPGERDAAVPELVELVARGDRGTTPASAAALIAATTRSRDGSISGSPSERLITSMPSCTAASMPAAISGALPFEPEVRGRHGEHLVVAEIGARGHS